MKIKRDLTVEDFIEMEKLELKFYSSEHVTPHEEAYKWHLAFPMAGTVLEDKGKIIAFIDLLPIKDHIFHAIKSGNFDDKYLTVDDISDIAKLKTGESINLLLSCIVVDEDYRKTDALKILLVNQISYYQSYTKKGISIENIITSNVTKQGERFSERMGFEKIGQSEHGTALYLKSFESFCMIISCL